MAEENKFIWTDNPTVSGVSVCDTDVLNDCLMHLKYDNQNSSIPLFTTIYTDYLLNYEQSEGWALQGTYVYKEAISGSRYGYPDFYAKCLDEKETATATETTLGANTITMYVNANGHKFYNIADKAVIDEWYETYGIADFYGVDTENERIFLPRNKHFMQLTDDTSKVNEMVEAGLPNITGRFGTVAWDDGGCTGAFYGFEKSPNTIKNEGDGDWRVYFDASRSNSTYGKSDTVQPQASLKLLYYCVGNTNVQSAITDVTQITTSENDTLPLFHNFYSQEDMTSTGAYVNASLGSWLSGNVYETAYNELVNKIGTDNIKAVTDTYTDYDFVVNQDDMTFRLPLLNGEESLPSDKRQTLTILPSDSTYTAPQNGWYSFVVISSVANGLANLYCEETGLGQLLIANATQGMRGSVPVSKGDVVHYIYPNNSMNLLFFTPAKGDGNLYYKVANAVKNLELLNAGEVLNAVNSLIPDNSSLIAGYAMPSNKYIDLTLGATETEYTSPANGWINIVLKANGAIGWVGVKYDAVNFISVSPTVTERISVCVPIKKGTKFTVGYGNCYAEHFRFIYAQGSKSEV